MKKVYIFMIIPAVIVLLSSFGGDDNSDYPGGSPAGYTGSPGDGNNCTSCHGGSATTVNGLITSDVPASGYVPGMTYTITASVTGSGAKGFQASPQDASGNLMGTLMAGTNNHLNGNNKYVNHNSAVNTSTATWIFTWTAPAAGSGAVTFYGAFAVSKSATKLSTLTIPEYNMLGVAENCTEENLIFPNPCHDSFTIRNVKSGIVMITGADGRTFPARANGGKFNVSMLPSGVYFAVVDGKIYKFLKW